MMFLRSNHIKEFTYSYGMHACKMAWHAQALRTASVTAVLGVLALLPAGGSRQLTQYKVKRAPVREIKTTSCIMLALVAFQPAAERTCSCVSH